jgi:hypothetical protein
MRAMPDAGHIWSPEDAKRILDEWGRSDEPLAAFGRRHGFGVARLYWWKKRLATPMADRATLSLVPAVVTAEALPAPITIRLPNGIGIETANASPAWIAALVAELSRSS